MFDTTIPCEQYFFTPDKTYQQTQAISISWAGYRVCDNTHVVGPRVLDTYKIVFILSGKGYLIQDDNPKITLNANDMFILFSNHRHHYWADPDEPWTITWVAFQGSDTLIFLNSLRLTLSNFIIRGALSDSIKRKMEKLILSLSDESDTFRLEAVSILFSVMNKLRLNQKDLPDSNEDDEESLVSRVVGFIEQNYYMDVDMNMICQYVHYSRSYLSRTFKAQLDMTIQDFLRYTRINKSKSLLSETSLSILEVATSVGINDALYFSKVFHKETGYSPREYRSKFSTTKK